MGVYEGRIERLAVSMPPRHGKSESVSKYLPAWWLGMRQDQRVILTSYEADFAASWGRKARDILREHGHLFDVEVRGDSDAANRWEIVGHDGGMMTAGLRGALTGKGAHLLIVDDPLKNAEEARSKTIRDKNWDAYLSTVSTRLEPGGAVIVVATRWHEDDLIGRLLNAEDDDEDSEQWTVINLPAIADEDDEHRKAGEALWPWRYPEDRLRKIQRRVGPYWWAALFQQRPAPEDGSVFKRHGIRWFRDMDKEWGLIQANGAVVTRTKAACLRFQTVDLAVSESEQADWTVVSTWDLTTRGELIWVGMHRERVEGANHVQLLETLYGEWSPATIGIEDAQFQLAVVKHAAAANLPATRLRAKGDKYARSLTAGAKWDIGNVYLPENASWAEIAIAELVVFPHGTHDDIVDTLSYAAIKAAEDGSGIAAAYGVVTCSACGHMFHGADVDRPCPKCGSHGRVE